MTGRILQLIGILSAAVPAAGLDPVAPPAQEADASSIVLAPKPAAPAASARSAARPVSPGIASDIAAGLPAFAGTPAPSPEADLRDLERPRNQIPRLPVEMMKRYTVHEARLPEFRTVDLYTPAGLTDLAFKEHPGLRIGNIFNLNAKAAYAAIMDELRASNRQGLVDTTFAMAVGGDTEEGRLLQQAILDEEFMQAGKDGPVGIR